MVMRMIIFLALFIKVTIINNVIKAQNVFFEYDPTPVNSGFKMNDYWVWCGSMIRVDSTYHLFASRWPRSSGFPEGYRENSEIVRATSDNPYGPFKFEEIVIGERDTVYWDSNMAHNPTIHKIGDEFVLFYIGSDFTTYRSQSKVLLRRIGYARSKSICGPWQRSAKPVIGQESNNPALLADDNKILLMYRDEKLKVSIAEAEKYRGPYTTVNDNVWPDCKLEDFYLFKTSEAYHMICEDNVGGVSGHERWGIHLISQNGRNEWHKYSPLVVYDHEIKYDNDTILKCTRRERPQVLIEDDKITYLITSVYDGMDSWSQPVRLKYPISLK
jgi:hypothetical protein